MPIGIDRMMLSRFGEVLERHIRRTGIRRKDLAAIVDKSPSYLTDCMRDPIWALSQEKEIKTYGPQIEDAERWVRHLQLSGADEREFMSAAKENLMINSADKDFRPTLAKLFRSVRSFEDLIDLSFDLKGLLESHGIVIPKTITKRLETLSEELDDSV